MFPISKLMKFAPGAYSNTTYYFYSLLTTVLISLDVISVACNVFLFLVNFISCCTCWKYSLLKLFPFILKFVIHYLDI